MRKNNELVTKGVVKKAIRKEMDVTWGFMCMSHRAVCRRLIKAIDQLPVKPKKPEAKHGKDKT